MRFQNFYEFLAAAHGFAAAESWRFIRLASIFRCLCCRGPLGTRALNASSWPQGCDRRCHSWGCTDFSRNGTAVQHILAKLEKGGPESRGSAMKEQLSSMVRFCVIAGLSIAVFGGGAEAANKSWRECGVRVATEQNY